MSVRVAVVGCTHGALDAIYAAIAAADAADASGRAVDLLICCGDFQACRNEGDLSCMSCPDKYLAMHDFYRYYSGAVTAPVPTLFIGGNHEASNHLGELPLGGWAAPRVLYLGASGVVNFGGLRIGGVSGIHKGYSFWQGYHERPPYSEDALKSVNHQRAFDFWRVAHCCSSAGAGGAGAGGAGDLGEAGAAQPMDIFLTHDWPAGIVQYGDAPALLRAKPYFAEEVAAGALGSPPAMQLLHSLRPRFWFAGHLHVKFAALVPHVPPAPGAPAPPPTRFLALDKSEGRRDFLQVLDIPLAGEAAARPPAKAFHYDPYWCAVLRATHAATPLARAAPRALPRPAPPSPALIAATAEALAGAAAGACGGDAGAVAGARAHARAHPLRPVPMPSNWAQSAAAHAGGRGFSGARSAVFQAGNPQMDYLLWVLGLPHATTVPVGGAAAVGGGAGGAEAALRAYAEASSAALAAASAWEGGAGGVAAAAEAAPPPPPPASSVPVPAADANEIDIS